MITIVVPSPTLVITRFSDVEVYVTADSPALKRAIVSAEFPGTGRTEVVYDGAAFKAPYLGSLREAFTNGPQTGFRFLIRRDQGWVDAPTPRVRAYDTAGGDATG